MVEEELRLALRWVARHIHHHPYIVVFAFAAATAFLYAHAAALKTETDMTKFIRDDIPELRTMRSVANEFGSTETVVVLIGLDDHMEEPDAVRDMRDPRVLSFTLDLAGRLEELKEVSRTECAARTIVQRGRSLPATLAASRSLHGSMPSLARFYNRAYSRTVVFAQGSVSHDEEKLTAMEAKISEKALAARPPPGLAVEITGQPSQMRAMIHVLVGGAKDSAVYSFVFVLLCLYVYFRPFTTALLPMLPIVFTVVWTAGSMELLGIPLSTITVGVSAMLIGAGIDYGIQTVNRFIQAREDGEPVEAAVETALSDTGSAVLAAAMTTIAGFLALLAGDIVALNDLGASLALGILFSLLSSLLLLPALLVLAERWRGRYGAPPHRAPFLDGAYEAVGSVIASHTTLAIVAVLLATALMATGAQYVRTLTDMSADSPKSLRVVRTMDLFRNEFGSSESAFIVFRLNEEAPAPRTLADRGFVLEMHRLAQLIARERHVDSVTDPMDAFRDGRVPYGREFDEAVEDQGKLGRYFNPKRDIAMMAVSTNIKGDRALSEEFMSAIERDVEQCSFPSHVSVEYSGSPAFGRVIGTLIGHDMETTGRWSLVFVILIVFAVYRSPALAAVCLMPMLISVVWVFGIMGYLGIAMTMATSAVFSMLMGLGIDFSIYLGSRYRTLRDQGLEPRPAMARTYRSMGSAITLCAATTIVGFAAMTIGDNPAMERMGLVLSLGLTSCLVGAIMIVPPVIRLEEQLVERWRGWRGAADALLAPGRAVA